MNLIFIEKGYPVAIIKNENRRKYLTALNQADKGDITPFVKFISDALTDTERIILGELQRLSDKYPG